MKSVSVPSIPLAVALVLATGVSTAEDKVGASKSPGKAATATATATANTGTTGKATARAPAPLSSPSSKAPVDRHGSGPASRTPASDPVVPATSRDHGGSCHDKDSDA